MRAQRDFKNNRIHLILNCVRLVPFFLIVKRALWYKVYFFKASVDCNDWPEEFLIFYFAFPSSKAEYYSVTTKDKRKKIAS